MKVTIASRLGAITLTAAMLVGCGGPAATTSAPATTNASTAAAAPAGDTSSRSSGAKAATVTKEGAKIVFTGSGDGTIGPVDFDQPYYVVRSSGSATMISAVETNDGIGILVGGSFGTSVFRVVPGRDKGDKFEVSADGDYRIELTPPGALPSAVAAPANLTGAAATHEIFGPFSFAKETSMVLTYKGTSTAMLPAYTVLYDLADGTLDSEARITSSGDKTSEPEPISADTKGFFLVNSDGPWEITFG